MCIFSGDTTVSGTNIFVARSGQRQLTAYQMEVAFADRAVAMILPAPIAPGAPDGGIKLLSLENVKDFFSGLDMLFQRSTRGGYLSADTPKGGFLEVRRVGNYDVSIALNPADIDRIDPAAFKVDPSVRSMLEAQYGPDRRSNDALVGSFGFVVCQLRKGGEIHPMAYTHMIQRDMFIPTRHAHGHLINKPRWDHKIYVMDGEIRAMPDPYRPSEWERTQRPVATWVVETKRRAPELSLFLDSTKELRLYRVKGYADNMDMEAA